MPKKICFLFLLMLLASAGYSQCNGSLGTPIINETFGAGTSQFGAPAPSTMEYIQNTCPEDGYYTVVNATTGCYGAWHTLTDHTGDPNGYFMLVNANFQPSDFFIQSVNGLCDGTTYEFAAWIINMFDIPGGINPDITFTIEKTDGTILKSFDTGAIKYVPNTVATPADWSRFGFYFTTPAGVSTVVLRMHNNAPGGYGNDLALDDITFTPSGPKTTVAIDGITGSKATTVCSNQLTLSSTVGNCYATNGYQWQISTDSITFKNIPGANNPAYTVNMPAPGTYYYRLNVAESDNIANPNCSANSNVYTVFYSPPVTNLSAAICAGSSYVLPSGKTVDLAGLYSDTLHYKNGGCDSLIVNLNLSIHPTPDLGPDKLLCLGDSIILNPGTFTGYLWQDGSTTPVYKATTAGTYWVTVTDEYGCLTTDTVKVKLTYCSPIKPPNTFTPNGDGINDTWNIKGLQYFNACTVSVYNRWGERVFSSVGYGSAWDGRYNSKELPVGTYYYIIDLKNGTPKVSGYVTIIR
jgi:gliding motility-associated-like protein